MEYGQVKRSRETVVEPRTPVELILWETHLERKSEKERLGRRKNYGSEVIKSHTHPSVVGG